MCNLARGERCEDPKGVGLVSFSAGLMGRWGAFPFPGDELGRCFIFIYLFFLFTFLFSVHEPWMAFEWLVIPVRISICFDIYLFIYISISIRNKDYISNLSIFIYPHAYRTYVYQYIYPPIYNNRMYLSIHQLAHPSLCKNPVIILHTCLIRPRG